MATLTYVRKVQPSEDVQGLKQLGFIYIRINKDFSTFRESNPMYYKFSEIKNNIVIHTKSSKL